MGVSGNLKTMLPGDLLQWLSLGQKTGTLVVASKSVEKKIFFKQGRVISSASNDPREYLGQFLISHGFLTEQELMKAMEVQQQSGILLGKILVMIDVISEPDLLRLMRLKAEEEIYEIFLWPEGDFHFLDDELPAIDTIPLQVDVTAIIMEGSRRVDEWTRIREVIPNAAMVPIESRTIDISDLDDVAKTVVKAMDGKRTIAEIELEARASPFVVCSTLHHLVRDGFVRLMELGGEKAARVAEETAPFEEYSESDEVASLLTRAQRDQRRGGGDPRRSVRAGNEGVSHSAHCQADLRDHADELHAERGLHPLPHQRPVGPGLPDEDQPDPRVGRHADFLQALEGRHHRLRVIVMGSGL